tara:strand:+ start:38 stop:859 length:822 start_codon:yes stop_codon:yes gene_type:complete
MINKIDTLVYDSSIKEIIIEIFTKQNINRNVLVVTINREEKLNAINDQILTELINIFEKYSTEDSIGSVVLTGAGNKSFIAGADIALMSSFSPEKAFEYSIKGQHLVKTIANYSKPVFGVINGYALGGGCEIALACHLRYSSPNAIFGQPEVKLGIIAGWGGTQNLSRLIGPSNALDLLLSGRNIPSDEAFKMGLINGVFEEKLLDNVLEVAFKINNNSPYAISQTIKSVKNGYNKDLDEALEIESLSFKKTFANSESKIGLKSFLKKEKPKF